MEDLTLMSSSREDQLLLRTERLSNLSLPISLPSPSLSTFYLLTEST
jgi:hypothetical protein